MKWAFPSAFWGLVVIPLLAVLVWFQGRAAADHLRLLVAQRLKPRLVASSTSVWPRFVLLLLALGFVCLAWARPQWGGVKEDRKGMGRDVIIAVDVSRSMLADDFPPSRLRRAKLAAEDLVRQLPGDRIGLVAFAGSSFLQAPVTSDHSAILAAIQELDTELIPLPGTNIADALRVSVEAFERSEGGQRAVVLISDGEDLEEDGIRVAKELAGKVRVFTLGVGTPEGTVLLVPSPRGGKEYIHDASGNIVSSRLDEARMRELASVGGGFYLRLQSGPAEMRRIVQDGIMQMDQHEVQQEGGFRVTERYQWPLGVALAFFAAALIRGEGGRRRLGFMVFLALSWMFELDGYGAAGLSKAREFYEAGDYAKALEAYDSEWKSDPKSFERAYNLGTAAYKNKKWVEAIDAFGQALASSDPRLRGRAEYNFANTLVQQAQQGRRGIDTKALEQAIEHYSAALKDDPNLEDAAYNRDWVKKFLEQKKRQPEKQQGKDGEKDKQDGGDSDQDKEVQRQPKDDKDSSEENKKTLGRGDKDGAEGQNQGDGKEGGKSDSSDNRNDDRKSEKQSQTAQNQDGKPPQTEPRPEELAESKARGELKDEPMTGDGKTAEQERREGMPPQQGGDGRITRAQAQALVDALRSEDRRVHLWIPDGKQQKESKAREWRNW